MLLSFNYDVKTGAICSQIFISGAAERSERAERAAVAEGLKPY
jgi:hypothetical protein